jgi:hypothetical protein
VEAGRRFQLKRFNLLFRKQLLGPKKVGKAYKNGLRFEKMHLFAPENKKLLWFTSKVIVFMKTLELKGAINFCYGKPLLCKTKYHLPKHGLWHKKCQKSSNTNGHPVCFEPIPRVLVIV